MKATKHRFWLCALLVCMVLSVFAGITAPPAMAANISSTDWMETVPDETKLSNMSIPGTHDSCTQYVDMRYIFQCQDASVATQLIYGYRYLDMRLVLAALAVSPESVGAQLPMLDLACRLGTAGVVYAVLLFLGMFGTSVSSLVAVLTYAGQKSARLAGHRMALLLVLTAAAFAGSLFGFGDLIGTVYPVYGYLGMAAMLLVAEHAVHARRAGKHCAATGD